MLEVKQQRPKAEVCVKWFSAMATDEEKRILKPPRPATDGEPVPMPDDGKRRAISMLLNTLIVQRLAEAYEAASVDVPRDFSQRGAICCLPQGLLLIVMVS